MTRSNKTAALNGLALLAGISSCSNQRAVTQSHITKIIGTDDRVAPGFHGENLPERYRKLLPAFGAMRQVDTTRANGARTPLCTFTHIGNGLAITAGHCLGAEEGPVTDAPCDHLLIDWNYTQGENPQRSKCKRIISAVTNDDLGVDFGLVSLDNPPEASIPLSHNIPEPNAKITLFGFPLGRTLVWSGTCLLQDTLGIFSQNYVGHQCDTEGGNSGSALIDDTDLSIIGVHDGGVPELNYGSLLVNVRKVVSGLP